MRKGKRFKEKVKNNKIRILILVTILLISVTMVVLNLYNKKKSNNDDIFNQIANDNSKNDDVLVIGTKTDRMLLLEELQKQNSDIIGWLQIENSNINYPVLQGEDNSYYMSHNYKKEYSKYGSLF